MGVSIAICCHNGEKRLPSTISHLKRQRVTPDLKWEVVVIDNASTDATAIVARQCWGDDGPVPMRILHEARLGLSHARERAFEEAHYEIVSFVDDDNWVAPEWVTTVSKCMSADSELGAIGSTNSAVAEASFPEWFSRWAHHYAAHASCEFATLESWLLVGAGMTIRKRCWTDLRQNGFRSQLSDRVGTNLASCGDLELGCAIQLAGWKIRVEPQLRLQHYMPPERLRWTYLRKMVRTTGQAMALLDSYFFFSRGHTGLKGRLRQYWWAHLIKESLQVMRQYSIIKIARSCFRDMEGDDDVPRIELCFGRLLGLLELRSRYQSLHRDVAQAPWRRAESTALTRQ
jgi:cellulose synthase/poly-beta-1,6-N-acetylglucosamine synthase-like glycosyltransferase